MVERPPGSDPLRQEFQLLTRPRIAGRFLVLIVMQSIVCSSASAQPPAPRTSASPIYRVAESSPPAPSDIVAEFSAIREDLLRSGKVNVPEMSSAIRAAVTEAEKALQSGDLQTATGKLDELRKYGPIDKLPSFDVQMLESFLALKRGDAGGQQAFSARAAAMRELLWNRSGTGTQSDPVRAIMVNDIAEWVRSRLGKISEVKPAVIDGRNLQAITYTGPDTANQPRTVYFAVDPRYMAMVKPPGLFTAIPLAQMSPEMQRLLEAAKAKRNAFLDDATIPFLKLANLIRDKSKQSDQLVAAGKATEALAALNEIAAIRPIEDIPTPSLLTRYSALCGRTGASAKQTEMRGLAFGAFQAMAASGDALTPKTAIEVIFVEEEYAWLNDKHLVFSRQSLVRNATGVMDVMTAKDSQGNERDYYFNITRLSLKEQKSLENHE